MREEGENKTVKEFTDAQKHEDRAMQGSYCKIVLSQWILKIKLKKRKAAFKIHNVRAPRVSGVRKAGVHIVAFLVREKIKKPSSFQKNNSNEALRSQ